MPFAAPLSTVSVQDSENMWLVMGLALNKVVVSQIAHFVGPTIDEVYTHITKSQGIHQQSHVSYLTHYPANAQNTKLPYTNINYNASTNDKSRWDYAVRCPFDFAKFVLQPSMAQCHSLDTCGLEGGGLSVLAVIIRGG